MIHLVNWSRFFILCDVSWTYCSLVSDQNVKIELLSNPGPLLSIASAVLCQ